MSYALATISQKIKIISLKISASHHSFSVFQKSLQLFGVGWLAAKPQEGLFFSTVRIRMLHLFIPMHYGN